MRKLFCVILGCLCGVTMCLGLPSVVLAEGEDDTAAEEATGDCGAPQFLGFKPWYAGLCDEDNEIVFPEGGEGEEATNMKLATFVWTIILNVVFDVILVVGYLAIGFIIYGGFLYITSQGDPGKAAKGKQTLASAIIGTVIAMLASIAVNTLEVVLGINDLIGLNQGDNITKRIGDAFAWAYSAAGIIAVVFIIKGAVQYSLSQGDPGKVQTATRSIIYAVVGLVIVLLAAAITAFVMNATGGAME